MYLYQDEMAKPETLSDPAEVMRLYGLMARQNKSMSKFYEKIGERIQMRRKVMRVRKDWIVSSLLVMVMIGLLVIAPVRGQDATDTVEVTPPVVVEEPVEEVTPPVVVINGGLSEGAQIAIIVVIGCVIIGGLTLLYIAVKGLRDSYPPGTATSFEKTWESINKKATETVNPYDDLAVTIAQPLIDAIVKAIRDKELVAVAAGGAGVPAKVYSKTTIPSGATKPLPEDDELG